MNILTICLHGRNRSVAVANYIKGKHPDWNVIPIGIDLIPSHTLEHLCTWADKIIATQQVFYNRLPEKFQPKAMVCEVGEDTYQSPFHADLLVKVKSWCDTNNI